MPETGVAARADACGRGRDDPAVVRLRPGGRQAVLHQVVPGRRRVLPVRPARQPPRTVLPPHRGHGRREYTISLSLSLNLQSLFLMHFELIGCIVGCGCYIRF